MGIIAQEPCSRKCEFCDCYECYMIFENKKNIFSAIIQKKYVHLQFVYQDIFLSDNRL